MGATCIVAKYEIIVKRFCFLVVLLIGAQVNALHLRDDSDFDWVVGCEISEDGFNYDLVYEDMVKKEYPDQYEQLILDQDVKHRSFKKLDAMKERGYLCAPVSIIKFDLKMGAYDQYLPGFSLSQEGIPDRLSVENEYFKNLPNPYRIELFEFSVPKVVKIDKAKAYRMLQRCPEILKESDVLLEVYFVFFRKGAGHYVGVPKTGRISANCELMPDQLMELINFEYKENK